MALFKPIPPKRRRWVLYVFSVTSVTVSAGIIFGWPALRAALRENGSDLSESDFGLVFTAGAWSAQGGRFFTGMARDRFGTARIASFCLVATALGSIGIAVGDPSNAATNSISLLAIGLGAGVQLCVQPVASLFPENAALVLSTLTGAFQASALVFLLLTTASASTRASFVGFTIALLCLAAVAFVLLPVGSSFKLPHITSSPEDMKPDDTECTDDAKDVESQDVTEVVSASGPYDDMYLESLPKIEEVSESFSKIEEFSESVSNLTEVSPSTSKLSLKQTASADPTVATSCEDPTESTEDPSESTAADLDPTAMVEPKRPAPFDQGSASTSALDTDRRVAAFAQKIARAARLDEDPPSAREQIQTAEYALLVLWFSTVIAPAQYFIGSIGYQLEQKGDADGSYTQIFLYCYAGAALVSPVAGYVADKYGIGVAQAVASIISAIPFFLLASNLALEIQVVGLALYGVGRLFVLGTYFGHLGVRFGYANYGRQ